MESSLPNVIASVLSDQGLISDASRSLVQAIRKARDQIIRSVSDSKLGLEGRLAAMARESQSKVDKAGGLARVNPPQRALRGGPHERGIQSGTLL